MSASSSFCSSVYHQVFVKLFTGQTTVVSILCNSNDSVGEVIKNHIYHSHGIPVTCQRLLYQGLPFLDTFTVLTAHIRQESSFTLTLSHGLNGGKGGFGAMLRAMAKQQGDKKTTVGKY